VAVVGGGNSALQTAIEMSGIATSLDLIVRSTIKADAVYVEKIKAQRNITVHTGSQITGLEGERFLTGITIRNGAGKEEKLAVDGVFIEIGWLPNTDFLEGLMPLNERKEIIVDCNSRTAVPGVFAAGDVTSVKNKQIIIAAGDGAKAALEAFEYLVKEWKEE
jgi:alkyl hydroperoxide reductase subunit F